MSSKMFVFLQLVAIAGLTYFSSIPGLRTMPDTVSLVGILLGIWSVWEMMNLGRYSIFPEVPKGATLVTTGPYALIRHPMYTALMIYAAGRVLNSINVSTVFFALLLFYVLKEQIDQEEEYLRASFPRYKSYQKSTSKLIPGLY